MLSEAFHLQRGILRRLA